MLFTQEQRRLLWLSAAEITADRVQRMLEQRGSAQALWEDFSAGVALSANAEANRFLTRYHSELALDALCERLEKKKVTPLFLEDDRYPPLLKCIDDPPYVLYTMGDPSVLSRPSVAVVGTRYPSGYGRNMARSIAYGLAGAGLSVVSGMARGIDAAAHEAALDLLRVRASSRLFRLGDPAQVRAKVSFPVSGSWAQVPGVIVMYLDDDAGAPVDERWRAITVAFNGTPWPVRQQVGLLRKVDWVLHPVLAEGSDAVVRQARCDDGVLSLPGRTAAVFVWPR